VDGNTELGYRVQRDTSAAKVCENELPLAYCCKQTSYLMLISASLVRRDKYCSVVLTSAKVFHQRLGAFIMTRPPLLHHRAMASPPNILYMTNFGNGQKFA